MMITSHCENAIRKDEAYVIAALSRGCEAACSLWMRSRRVKERRITLFESTRVVLIERAAESLRCSGRVRRQRLSRG
jgi:hypothetical protein